MGDCLVGNMGRAWAEDLGRGWGWVWGDKEEDVRVKSQEASLKIGGVKLRLEFGMVGWEFEIGNTRVTAFEETDIGL